MTCDSCGGELTHAHEVCAFCGNHSSPLPQAEVPVAHQRGEGRVVAKTYEDSLRSIQAGVDYSHQRYQLELRRSRFWVGMVVSVIAILGFSAYWFWQSSRPEQVDFDQALSAGIESVKQGDFAGGQASLLKAVQLRPSSKVHILLGSAHYSELLVKPNMDPRERKSRLYACYLAMRAARQSDPGDPRANFFMALAKYEEGDIKATVSDLETCLGNLSKITDPTGRTLYSDAATEILAQLQKDPKAKLPLVSQIARSRTEVQKKQGIEVPFDQ